IHPPRRAPAQPVLIRPLETVLFPRALAKSHSSTEEIGQSVFRCGCPPRNSRPVSIVRRPGPRDFPMPLRALITGATGFVGSHVAEGFAERGWPVVAVARAGSDTALLERLGVTLHRGDFSDAGLLRTLAPDADVIVHCAAKVGDWGPVEDYRAVNVNGLRNFLDVCKGQPLQRFVHMSSLGVYAARHHYGSDESEPLPDRHADGYTQTKVEAEQLVMQYYRDFGIPVVVLRPGFVYGPRDRTVMPRLIENLRLGK